MNRLVHVENLSFRYGKQSVLQEVNADFMQGELAVILGRNGSGKSTFFNIVAGIQRHYTGNIWVGQSERRTMKSGGETRIGFMTQFHQTTFPFRVSDVVLTGRASFFQFSPKHNDLRMVEEVLERFDLLRLKDKPYTTLSGGERQLVLLCRVLVQQPDIILLDEPTNHLDLHYQAVVMDRLKDLVKHGTTVVCVMHDPNMALLYGDRFFVMQCRQLTDLEGMSQDEMHRLLEKTYNINLEKVPHRNKNLVIPWIKNTV